MYLEHSRPRLGFPAIPLLLSHEKFRNECAGGSWSPHGGKAKRSELIDLFSQRHITDDELWLKRIS